jgi:hypothetical protein
LVVRSTSSVPRPELSPPRRSCILLAAARPLRLRTHATAPCYTPLNDGSRDVTEAMWWWRNHPPIRQLSCRPVCFPVGYPDSSSFKHACLKLQAASTLIGPTPVGVFCSSPVQPRLTAAELSSPKPVVSMLPKASPEIMIQPPPSVPTGGGVPVPGRTTCSRNTRYRAGATPYPYRTSTGWIAPTSPGARKQRLIRERQHDRYTAASEVDCPRGQ